MIEIGDYVAECVLVHDALRAKLLVHGRLVHVHHREKIDI